MSVLNAVLVSAMFASIALMGLIGRHYERLELEREREIAKALIKRKD
jgi:hypothetical protein